MVTIPPLAPPLRCVRDRRLKKEVEMLRESGILCTDTFSDSEGYLCVVIAEELTIRTCPHYPFYPPICTLSSGSYLSWLSKISRKLVPRGCLCCSSILCCDKWCPGIGLQRIYNEYVEYRDLLQIYQRRNLMNRILDTYGLGDIDITRYLTSELQETGGYNRRSEKLIT